MPVLAVADRAVEFGFVTYDNSAGLSSNTVRSVTQDEDGFLWVGTLDGLNRFDGRFFKSFSSANRDYHGLDNTSVFDILSDRSGRLWVGTAGGLFVFDKRRELFERFEAETEDGITVTAAVTGLLQNTDGKLWIGTRGQGWFIYDPETGSLVQNSLQSAFIGTVKHGHNGNVIIGCELGSIAEYDASGRRLRLLPAETIAPGHINAELRAMYYFAGRLWCGLETDGLIWIDLYGEDGAVHAVHRASHYPVKSILPYDDSRLLIGSDNGLYLFDIRSGATTAVSSGTQAEQGVDRFANVLFRDIEGGIWVGTQYAGLSYIKREMKPVDVYFTSGGDERGRIISSFAQDGTGRIWVGTEDDGIVCIENGVGITDPRLPGWEAGPGTIRSVRCLLYDRGVLWIGTPKNGIYSYETATGRMRNYRYDKNNNNTLHDDCVDALIVTGKGKLYAGTPWGFAGYDPVRDVFTRVMRGGNNLDVCGFAPNDDESFFVVSPSFGVRLYFPDSDRLQHYPFPTGDRSEIKCLCTDGDAVYLGSEAGIFTIDHRERCLVWYSDGGRGLDASAIATDKAGNIWVSTGNAVCCLADGRRYLWLTAGNGLPSGILSSKAALRAADGRLYFGTINGVASFDPARLEINPYHPVSVISDLYINDKPVEIVRPGSAEPGLMAAVYMGGRVELPYRNNSFAVSVSSSSYQIPARNRYAYLMEGLNREWVTTDDSYIRFEKIPPGRYRLYVRSSNDDGLWGSESAPLHIRIMPPFYLSWIALAVYLAVLAAGVWLAYRYVQARSRKRMREFLQRQEKQNYRSKMDFFTNIAHEIRTPLTLIKAPLDFILESGEYMGPRTRNYLGVMQRNANNLLDMTNQLLDLQKSEGSDYNPVMRRTDVSGTVREVCARFGPLHEVSGLRLQAAIADGIVAGADADALGKIAANLLSNATKYAASLISVELRTDGSTFTLTVTDDGPGIRPGEQESIFKSFYRSEGSKSGSGIGLSLVKLLVDKHKGRVSCGNMPGGGARFVVEIPCNLTPSVMEEEAEQMSGEAAAPAPGYEPEPVPPVTDGEGSQANVLVVEDNPELLDMMTDILSGRYNVLRATEGNGAIRILENHGADLVVTDIMMEGMDGYRLCEFIKSDISYCHIPVIQVTAKTNLADKIKGLGYGADAYMEKPFSPQHLLVQVQTMLLNRERIARSLRRGEEPDGVRVAGLSGRDREFLVKLDMQVAENIANETFSIEELAGTMFMSRSNFYRKIKALTGLAPNDYLKKYRLTRAAKLLQEGQYQITEIFEMVGFKSAAYFSVCFKEEYGMTPRQYRTQSRNGELPGQDGNTPQ